MGIEQFASVSHLSMTMGVGGSPLVGPFPSVGVSSASAPCWPAALITAWLLIVPDASAFTVTRNFTVVVSPTSIVPPVAAFAPAPSRRTIVLVPAMYSP